MSRFKALQKMFGAIGDDTAKVLEKIDSDKLATSLRGQERAEYLQALDEVYGPTSDREVLTGHTTNVFHGTPAVFDYFKTNPKGVNRLGEGNYVTPNSSLASGYMDKNGVILPLKVKTGKILDLNDNNLIQNLKLKNSLPDVKTRLGAEGLDSILNGIAKKEGITRVQASKKLATFIKQNGFDTIKDEDILNILEPKNIRSKYAAFDPRFKDSALLMAGSAAIPTTDISPMSAAKDIQEQILNPVVSRYNKLKSYITNPLAKQLDLTKDKSEAKSIKQALDMGLDPVNLIPGGAGLGVGALQMLGEEDEEE